MATDPFYRKRVRRHYLMRALLLGHTYHPAAAREIFGCTAETIRRRFERAFRRGMSWQNHGTVWHIDHKVPISWFWRKVKAGEMSQAEALRRVHHWRNLQPLSAAENLAKGA